MRNLFDNPLLLIALLLIVVLIFGSKRLPDAARSIGRSMRIFKSEVKEMKEDDGKDPQARTAPLEGRVVTDHRDGNRVDDPAVDHPRAADEHRRGA